MNNIITYTQNQLKTFQEEPLNYVDSLILSWISYIRMPKAEKNATTFRGVYLKDLFKAEYFDELFNNVYEPELAKQLWTALCASPRFRNIKILKYVQQLNPIQEKQFSAMTLKLDATTHFISFRGTDSTIVGWKEDFNMFFTCPIPSQVAAAKYTKLILKRTTGTIYLGGHSKGGNLAVYAGAINNQDRIKQIYTHDAPGFLSDIIQQPEFQEIIHKTTKIVPQSSFFGMVLESHADTIIIQSNRKSLWQHDPFSWEVNGNEFIYENKLSRPSTYVNSALENWMKQISIEQREQFIDLWYTLIQSTNLKTTSELQENWPLLIKALGDMDDEVKESILQITKSILSIGLKSALRQKGEEE